MFTSCCPGWVRFVKARYPEFVDSLSTSKSPQQMFGAIAKTYYAKVLGVEPERLFVVSVMRRARPRRPSARCRAWWARTARPMWTLR